MDLSEVDVRVMHLLDHACALACHVVQDIATRQLVILPSVGGSIPFANIMAARSWLREYAYCGRYARCCFHHGKHNCSVFKGAANQFVESRLVSV